MGTALAPVEFTSPNLANKYGKSVIYESELASLLGAHANPHLDMLIQIFTSFEICNQLKGADPVCYHFPCFITRSLEPSDWVIDPTYVYYHGRQVQCGEELDCLPPGFFNRLQVRVGNLYTEVRLFKDSFIVNELNAVCLVKTDEMNNQITFIVRACGGNVNHVSHRNKLHSNAHSSFLLLDILHQQLYKLLKVACPNISTKWHILSPMDLKAHKEDPYVYRSEEVIEAIHSNAPLINKNTGQKETLLEVLYCDCKEVEVQRSGKNMPIAFLPDSVLEGLEELLGDPDVPRVRLYNYIVCVCVHACVCVCVCVCKI